MEKKREAEISLFAFLETGMKSRYKLLSKVLWPHMLLACVGYL